MGTKTSQVIIYALRNPEILNRLPEKIDKTRIKERTLKQLENYIYNQLKPSLEIKSNFNYGELLQWVQEHSMIPEDKHEPFMSFSRDIFI